MRHSGHPQRRDPELSDDEIKPIDEPKGKQTSMPKQTHPESEALKLRSLEIVNYKKLDSLKIEFPPPKMAGDLDIMVLGSKNGGGKTSVLECSSLLFFSSQFSERHIERFIDPESFIDLGGLLIKSGEKTATISGVFSKGGDTCAVKVVIRTNGGIEPSSSGSTKILQQQSNRLLSPDSLGQSLASLLSFSGEPLIIPPLLHFNSYRKVQEGNPELGMMAEDYPLRRGRFIRRGVAPVYSAVSAFKIEVLRSMMGKASLFEGFEEEESKAILQQLNDLLKRYAGGGIEKLRPLPDNKIDFRVSAGDHLGNSFTFDGLSSGQKEIISTLFLIWRHSQTLPTIVLIDEPELHLNAEWHSDFIQQIQKLAPHNQYIVATHSEQIFRSVDENRRAVLLPAKA
jgi:predicted ATPase